MNKNLTLFLLTFCCLCSTMVYAGNDKNTLGSQAAAMGSAAVTQNNVYSVFNNQAGLANFNKFAASIYAESRYINNINFNKIAYYGLGVSIPTKSGTFGIGITYFGNEAYNEKKGTIAYGRLLFEKISIGAEIDVINIAIDKYDSKTALTFGLGIQYNLNAQLKAAAHLYNPLKIKLNTEGDERLASTLKLGLAFEPAKNITFIVETEKSIDTKPIFKGGIEYRIIEKLYLRGGIASNPTYTSFGVGVNLNNIKIDISSSMHPQLGYTPHFSLTYQQKNKPEAKPKEEL